MQFSSSQTASLPSLLPGRVASPLLNSLCTGQIHPAERVRAWVDAMSRFAGFPIGADASIFEDRKIGFEPLEGSFAGRIDYIAFCNWRLAKVAAGASSLTFDPEASHSNSRQLLVALQYKGSSTFIHNGQEVRLGSGELAVIPVHRPVRIVNERQVEHYLLWCLPPMQGWPQGLQLSSMHHLCGKGSTQRLLRSFVEMLLAEPAMCTPLREEYLARTLAWLLEQSLDDRVVKGPPPSVHASRPSRELVVRYIEDNLHDPELSPESIAQALGCSKRTLHRAFDSRDGGGESLNRFVWRRRVERCADELRSAGAPGRRQTVTQVAYSFGFSSCAHFSRLFKQHVGVAPLRYRQGK